MRRVRDVFVYYGGLWTVDVPEPPARRYAGEPEMSPNAFKAVSGTNINYSVNSPCMAKMVIIDASGRVVATMTDPATRGENRLFQDGRGTDGSGIASGVYFCKIRAGDLVSRRKMMLVQ